jgi:hypothetical protein
MFRSGVPTVLSDASTKRYLITYTTGNNAIAMHHGSTLLSWFSPTRFRAITHGTNRILYPTRVGDDTDPGIGNG